MYLFVVTLWSGRDFCMVGIIYTQILCAFSLEMWNNLIILETKITHFLRFKRFRILFEITKLF